VRFTIAHELGHYFVNQGTDVHVDKQILFRSEQSSNAMERSEIAANAFAAELLMPSEIVHQKYAELCKRIYRDDDALVDELAKLFGVSTVAMGFRLKNLGLILT
jgi:Zn-dependent peptidase ImmA (M78 family)